MQEQIAQMEEMKNIHAREEEIKDQGWIDDHELEEIGGEKRWSGLTEVVAVKGNEVSIDQGIKMATIWKDKCI